MVKKKAFYIVASLFGAIIILCCVLMRLEERSVSTMNTGVSAAPFTIVVDAGHGGIDGGAVAKDGTEEKGINLAIAQKLDIMLRAFGATTVMTRSEDISIHDSSAATIKAQKISDIHNRLKLVNDTPNSILISIHQNFFEQPQYHGMQVFYSKNTAESQTMAQHIQTATATLLQTDNQRKIKPGESNLYLLHKATHPSVLVECGFMSNVEENSQLKQAAYQKQLAFCITKGVLDFYAAPKEVTEATT